MKAHGPVQNAALWSLITLFGASAAIFTKYCDMPASSIGFWRVLGAVVVLLPWWLQAWRAAGRPPLFTPGALIAGALLGAHFTTWCWALLHTTVANASLFVGVQPLITPFIARVVLRERLQRGEFLAVALACAGTVWIVQGQLRLDATQLAGTLVALLSAVLCAAYFVTCRKCRADQHIMLFSVSVYAAAALTQAGAAVLLDGGVYIGNTRSMLAVLALILLPTLGGHTLAMYLLKHVTSQVIALSIPTQFIFSTVAAVFLFAQVPSRWFYPGAALILVGVVLGIICAAPAAQVPTRRGSPPP